MIDKDFQFRRSDTLCWQCSKACGGCSWSDKLVPVKGWTAQENYIASGGFMSYNVERCPQFVHDSCAERKKPDDFNTDGCMLLLEKAMEAAREDYLQTTRMSTRDEVVCFLADWLPDFHDAMNQLHLDRYWYWGKRELDRIERKIQHQPVLLYAGGDG